MVVLADFDFWPRARMLEFVLAERGPNSISRATSAPFGRFSCFWGVLSFPACWQAMRLHGVPLNIALD